MSRHFSYKRSIHEKIIMTSELKELLQKQYKNSKFFSGEQVPPIRRLSTHICGLDIMLGGGLPLGRIMELYGAEHLGKTALSLAMCKGVEEQGLQYLLIDLETTVSREHLIKANLDPEKSLIVRPDCGEDAIDIALSAAQHGVSLIIIDSLPLLLPRSVEEKIEKDSESKDFAAVAGLLNRVSLKMIKGIEQSNCCLLFINQVRDKINSPYGGINTPGGHTIKHLFSIRAHLTHAELDKENPGRIISHAKTVKNKTHTNSLNADFVIEQGVINRSESLLSSAINLGIIEKAGAWYKLNGESIGQGSKKAAEYLESNSEIYESIYNRCLDKAGLTKKLEVNKA